MEVQRAAGTSGGHHQTQRIGAINDIRQQHTAAVLRQALGKAESSCRARHQRDPLPRMT
jgi:hypothetical protein